MKCGALTAAPLAAGTASAKATGTAATNAASRRPPSSPPHAATKRLTLERRGGPVDENALKREAPDASERSACTGILPLPEVLGKRVGQQSRCARDTLTAPHANTQTTFVTSSPDVGPCALSSVRTTSPLARSSISLSR